MRPARSLARLPIRAKLTLAYCGVIAVVLGAIGAFLYLHFRSGLDHGLNQTLRARARDVSALLRQEGVRGLDRRRDLLVRGELAVQVLSRDGRLLLTSSPRLTAPLVDRTVTSTAGGRAAFVDRGERIRLLVRRAEPGAASPVLVVQASLEQRERALELLNGALLVGGGLTLLVAALAGYLLAGAVLRPMEAMRGAAARISDIDPQARLPLPIAQDEVHRLGVTLNEMLARLQRARDRERAFLSDASHELRTPVAILKTEAEVALRRDNPPEELREALRVVNEEADRLTYLAEDLLLVARSEADRLELSVKPLAVRPLLEDMARRFRMRAGQRDRSITVEAPETASVTADRSRVEQALGNLVDNALRHGAGTITLRAVPVDGHVDLHVIDEGDGFAQEFMPHAFERFAQQRSGRSGEGSGLGLSIVELIAAAHGGAAGVANRTDGSGGDAWLRLPQ